MNWGMKAGILFFGGIALMVIISSTANFKPGTPFSIGALFQVLLLLLGLLMFVLGIIVSLVYKFTDFLLSPEEKAHIQHNRKLASDSYHKGLGWEAGKQEARRREKSWI